MQWSTPNRAERDDLAQIYNAAYYAHSLGEPCHRGSSVWHAFFGAVADTIVADIQPRTALDAGCGIGILVEELRHRRVDARGLDISAYAIGQVADELQPYCTVGSILDPLPNDYDLIACIEVLEHLPPELAGAAVANLVEHTDAVLFSSTPDDFREPTHLNVRPTAFWVGLFARHGFYRDHSFDASVVSPHALLLRRKPGSIGPIIGEYESQRSQSAREVRELRASNLASARERDRLTAELERVMAEREATGRTPTAPINSGDPAWRLFVAMLGVRRRLAPEKTRRGDLVEATLQRLADGLDRAYLRFTHPPDRPAPRSLEASAAAPAVDSPPVDEAPRADSFPSPASLSEPKGHVDGPPPGPVGRRLQLIWGWAIDAASTRGPGIAGVRVYLDGVLKGTATYGSLRHDVQAAFGAMFVHSGWQFALDLHGITPGPHTLQVNALSAVSCLETTYSHPISVEPLRPPRPWRKLVLFISGCPGDSLRYRCEHAAEQVRLMGGTADVATQGDVDFGMALEEYHVFVLHRVLFGDDVEWFLAQAHDRRLSVVYDVDDLVFDDAVSPLIGAVDRMPDQEREQFRDCLVRARDALVRTEAAFASTVPLQAEVARALGGGRTLVVPNVASENMLRQASTALKRASGRMDRIRSSTVAIAYLSGTPTHDRDFLSAADGLIWALDEYPNARLITVGPVVVDDRFHRFGNRVERWPLSPWQRLAEVLTSVDINIAPLEPANLFTNSKSSIKYLEAGLVGVPTIASPRADFRRVITHGVNGFLAESPDEWRDALGSLIRSAELRHRVGQQAREDILERHTTASAAATFYAALAELAVHQSNLDERLIINWVVRGASDTESGGPTTEVLMLASHLTQRGHSVRICVVPRAGGNVAPRVDQPGEEAQPAVVTCADPNGFPPADVDIATDWSTARLIGSHGAATFRACFLQDLSLGAPPGPITPAYTLPVRYICYGQQIAEHLAGFTRQPIAHISRDVDSAQAGAELERLLLNLTLACRRATHPTPAATC